MQCNYYQILPRRTCEWSLWRGGRFMEVIFKNGSTVTFFLLFSYNVNLLSEKFFYLLKIRTVLIGVILCYLFYLNVSF